MQVYVAPFEAPGLSFVDGRFDMEATENAEKKYLEDLTAYVKENFNGPLAGEIIRTPFADGHAQYMVAKIQGRTSLIHIAIGDAWQDARFENTVTVKEIKEILTRQRNRARIFANAS